MGNENRLVNVYVDINPITNKVFYVGIGTKNRISAKERNILHTDLVNRLPNKKFIRKIIHSNIPIEKAYSIEMQIIKKCKRLFEGGTLVNIHKGGEVHVGEMYKQPWNKGKKMLDLKPDYQNPTKGKKLVDVYGKTKVDEMFNESRLKMSSTKKEKFKLYGLTEKQKINSETQKIRKGKGIFTENELRGFRSAAKNRKGKSMAELTGNPNWISPNRNKKWNKPHSTKGRTLIEIHGPDYINPRKGVKMPNLHPKDHIFSFSKPFYISINNESPVFCKSAYDFMGKFNCHKYLFNDLRKYKFKKIINNSRTKHLFPNNSIIRFCYNVDFINNGNSMIKIN